MDGNYQFQPCRYFLAADAALHLKRQHQLRYQDVALIEVSIPPLRYQRHFHAEVKTGLRGKFAVNSVVARCILEGRLEIATFTDAKANEPLVQEALGKVQVIVDKSIPEPGTYCPVSVVFKDGNRFTFTATIPKGHSENPMSEEEVLEKFSRNAREIAGPQRSEALIARLQRLDISKQCRRAG